MTSVAATITIGKPQARAETVKAQVDPHARRLVDAINTSAFDTLTEACCSGHYHRPSSPYIAFRSWNWDFIRFLLAAITGINRATHGQTRVSLRHFLDERQLAGSIRLTIYPWLLSGVDLLPLLTEQVSPPRILARLWWRELDELAAMIEERRTWPSWEFVDLFNDLRKTTLRRRGRLPAWAKRPSE